MCIFQSPTFNLNQEKMLASLYQAYLNERGEILSYEQFTFLLIFYPALLVVASDGVIDREEWYYCLKLANSLSNTFEDELTADKMKSLSRIYRGEFAYLLQNEDRWSGLFIEGLEKLVDEEQSLRSLIRQMMVLFADASNGISSDERRLVRYISRRLQLEYQPAYQQE